MKKQVKDPIWFRCMKRAMGVFIKKSEFTYLGEKILPGSIVLSNHEGTSAPLAMELYGDLPIRFWGAHEMNSGLFSTYRYLSRTFYHEKKHWPLWLARLFCILAAPFSNLFYRGLNLISTYRDCRLRHTLAESIDALREGSSIMIYPEISDKGYLKELEGFQQGFTLLIKHCLRAGMDVPLYVSYYQKEARRYVIDKPIYISQLSEQYSSREAMAQALCERCNQLGKMTA